MERDLTGAVWSVVLGPKTVKLIVPVAFGPLEPASVAWSEIVPPAVACGVALVVTVGEAFLTTTASAGAVHAVGHPALFVSSPEQPAHQREAARCTAAADHEEEAA